MERDTGMKKREQDPARKCAICGRRFDEHRGKRGCVKVVGKQECPCARFTSEEES